MNIEKRHENLRVCSRCVLDTTIKSIRFNDKGECNFCESHDRLLTYYPQDAKVKKQRLDELVAKIKLAGKGKDHDCILGVSGGTDSTYSLYMAVQLGLRPLAVHFDNGWSSDIAVSNIKKACSKLKIDLHTYVVNWEEFKNIQIAFLKASVPCIEVPTDSAISGTLYRQAKQEGIKYILSGISFVTEGTVPREWSFIDGTYIKNINKTFGKVPIQSYPLLTMFDLFRYTFVDGIIHIPFLNYFDYSKQQAKDILEKELDWKYYGGHHYENIYSHFAFGWYLLQKFNIDKRKITLAAQVRMGHVTREEALKILSTPPEVKKETIEYVITKLGLKSEEFNELLTLPPKTFLDYPTSYPLLKRFSFVMKLAVKLNLVTPVAYEKFVV